VIVLHDGDGRARDEHRGENGCERDHDPWSSTHRDSPFSVRLTLLPEESRAIFRAMATNVKPG
jgi:hypothetical protein